MSISAYINFNGNCKEALAFYADAFETGPYEAMTWGQMPPGPDGPVPAHVEDLIMHAGLTVCGSTLMFSDAWPEMAVTVGDHISLTVVGSDEAAIRRYFEKMKVGGQVTTELQPTFWTKMYGALTDKFGILWQFSLEE